MQPLVNNAKIPLSKSNGKLDLSFEQKRGKTMMVDCYQHPPLKASRGLYLDGSSHVTVYLMESSGGLVAGDRNDFNIQVGQGANVTLRPQSATKVYPAFNNQPSSQQISINLEAGAELEWDHEEVIPFKDASFESKTSIQMTPSSSLLWGEILYPGREKRGESFVFDKCQTHLEIWVDHHCIAYDTLHLKPSEQNLKKLGALETYNFIGSLWFISPKLEGNDWNVDGLLEQHDNHKSGVSTLNGNGILIRWLSNRLPLLKKELENLSNYFKEIENTV
ncbi:urease accessory protein UreD [Aquibacillus albus]|uniref:Urease accessory protein UreD n=1 Tax=Aquibacillus albus TaxID=1168171 RepID=A0ABS2MX85_9BACI|nr:urease accessory protein UreD [Aquibacillus albus]MBM7570475.1 urease accessory protein [Aquibacillus albus]